MIGSNMGMFFSFKKDKSKPDAEIHKLKCVKIKMNDITVNGIEDLLSVFNIGYKKSWSKTKKLGLLNARCD